MSASSLILLFQWLRWRTLRNTFVALQEKSLLRMISILLCSVVVWGSLFALCYMGFRETEAKQFSLVRGELMGTVFAIMFAALTGLLIFSTGIILYSSLFSSAEAAYLLTTPAPADHIFAYKLQGAIAFSSWAFVLLGSPVLIAYGMVVRGGASWIYFPSLALFFLGFILVPGSLGGLLALIVVNVVPRHRKQLIIAVALIVLVPAIAFTWHWLEAVSGVPFGTRDWFRVIFVNELSPLRSRWLPSVWISEGLHAASLGNLEQTAFDLTLVWSTGLFLYVATVGTAGRIYRRGYNRMASGGTLRKKYGGEWLDRLAARALFFVDGQTRLLIVKDFRTFRREPAQWFQIFIFLQLTVLYFWGMRSFYEKDLGLGVQNGISLLTLLAISFLTCAYTGRFIYPMLSLEGRKFWILGLLPMSRDRLLWGKFAFSAMGTVAVTMFLVVFSNIMLSMPWQVVVVHGLTACVVAISLSGLSVGLGACMPNFRENDPSKIALGLGGTLNLVACLLVLVTVIGLMAGPWHLVLWRDPRLEGGIPWVFVLLSLALGMIVGGAAALLALRSGIRSLRHMEF